MNFDFDDCRGQHDDSCFRCKLLSLNFNKGGHLLHARNGDPWEGNPVADRIKELHEAGARVQAHRIQTEAEEQKRLDYQMQGA